MRTINKIVGAALCAAVTLSASAEDVKHRFITAAFNRGEAVVIGKDGVIEKQLKIGQHVQDVWMLENGNIMASYLQGVKEVSMDGTVVWEYKTPNKQIEIHTAQPLPNGNVLMLEGGTKRLFEVNRKGEIVKDFPIKTKQGNKHMQFRIARKTADGHYWLALFGDSKAVELDADGKKIREIVVNGGKNGIHGLVPLPHGGILVSTAYGQEIKEFDKDGELIWHLTKKDLKNAGVKKTGYAAGLQRLPNGNTVISIYHGEPALLEVTPDKKMVWSYHNPSLGNLVGMTILDAEGPALR